MDDVRRARRGLLVFFAILVPLSGLFEALKIFRVRTLGPVPVIFLLMWTPAVASFVARIALREGFGDLSLRLGGSRGRRAVLLAAAFPLAVGALAYGLAWTTGLAAFAAPDQDLVIMHPAWLVPLTGSPAVRFARLLATHLTIGALDGCLWAAGEEIGWRGYLLPRLVDAKIPLAAPLSGLIWAAWHWPLAWGSSMFPDGRFLPLALFTLVVIPIACAMARQRLETGSLWPAIVLHGVWNEILGLVFGPCTVKEGIWLGESGILVAIASFLLLLPFLRGRWAARRTPGAPPYAELTVLS
ncbi:MAG: CPBP family intramembrane metalloprotease [Polyangiaceae bacterium]|nr:CPBP family intramembrane metalloprotease [Polyangiaceae bacterium]